MSGARKYKVAIIGCGNIAGGYDAAFQGGEDYVLSHAKAYQQHGGFDVVACVDPDEDKRKAFQERWSVKCGFSCLEEVIDKKLSIDVVSICSPTHQHVADLKAVLRLKPKLVFAEKPLSDDVEASKELIRLYEKEGVALAVNYFRQWDPVLRDIAGEVKAGEWGDFQHGTLHYAKGILNNATHYLNLAQMFLGPLSAKSVLSSSMDYSKTDPTLSALVSTEKGRDLFVMGGDCREYTSTELDMVFSKGRIAIEQMGLKIRLRQIEDNPLYAGYRWLGPAVEKDSGFAHALLEAVGNLYDHLENAQVIYCRGDEALSIQKLASELIAMAKKDITI